jgi:hypothetical protein
VIERMMTDAVHILQFGFSLCGFSNRVPLYWPKGHYWVQYLEQGANCEKCIEVYKNGL